jgi:hypothetical protein
MQEKTGREKEGTRDRGVERGGVERGRLAYQFTLGLNCTDGLRGYKLLGVRASVRCWITIQFKNMVLWVLPQGSMGWGIDGIKKFV